MIRKELNCKSGGQKTLPRRSFIGMTGLIENGRLKVGLTGFSVGPHAAKGRGEKHKGIGRS